MLDERRDFDLIRQIHAVLVLHFIEGLKQSEIAERLNLSTSKVNRLITQGRREGMVRIDVESPFQALLELEAALRKATGLKSAVVTPSVAGSADTTLNRVGRAAASELVSILRDGDVIAITGGKAVSAIVQNVAAERAMNVRVVPLTGGVQGKYYTDVNHLAMQLAERLGGTPLLMHAPLFAENRTQRDMLMGVASIREVLDVARQATVALVGIGSIEPEESSYYDLYPVPEADRKMLMAMGVVGEFLAHLTHIDGSIANYALNSRLVALPPHDLRHCKRVIGVAAGTEKALPIQSVLNGGFLNSLILDEDTALSVLNKLKGGGDVR